MKFFPTLFAAILTVFCMNLSNAQKWNEDNSAASEERNVSDFTAISVGGGIDVYITQGGSYECKVVADDRVIDKLVTDVRGNTLKIYFDKKVRRVKKAEVHLTVKNLKEISASGGSDVESKGELKFTDLKINASGGSDTELDLYCQNLTVSISGGADVDLEGRAMSLDLSASGGSDFDAYDFEVKEAVVSASGGSDSNIHVTESLQVNASGASDVNYKGNPTKTKLKSSGASDINSNK